MTDKEINSWLNRINEIGYFLLIKEIDQRASYTEQAKIYSENIDIIYLEKDLGLVISLLDHNKSGHVVKLSQKGIDVQNKGGWIKYKEKQNQKKRLEFLKKEALCWFNIVVPILSIYIAYMAVKKDNNEIKEQILTEMKTKQEEQKQQQEERVENLTRKMDSVLLKIEQKP